MREEQAKHDAEVLFAAIITNHPQARGGRAFSVTVADTKQVGLSPARIDAAVWQLIDDEMLERDEEASYQLRRVRGLAAPDAGPAFRLTAAAQEIASRAGPGEPT